MPAIFPKDASGTEFDPSMHNLLNDTAKPQLSSKGNFVKLKEGESNPADVVSRFLDNLADDLSDDTLAALAGEEEQEVPAPVEPAAPAENEQPQEQPEEPGTAVVVENGEDDIPDLTEEELASDGIIIEDADDDSEGEADEDEPEEETVKPKKQVVSSYKGDLSVDLILSIQDQARALDTRADFSKGYNLSGINLAGKDLRASMFNNCSLDGANFSGANLMGANFTGASLKGVNFKGTCLKYAILPSGFRNDCLMDENTTTKGVSE